MGLRTHLNEVKAGFDIKIGIKSAQITLANE
jgi:hypothetical protein